MSQDILSFVVEKLKVKSIQQESHGKSRRGSCCGKDERYSSYKKELFIVFASAPSQEEFLKN